MVPTHKKVEIQIDGQLYTVIGFLSIVDVEKISESHSQNYKELFSMIVHNHIVPANGEVPTVEKILRQDDTTFLPYISAVCSQNPTLNGCYHKREENSISERFILSIKDMAEIWCNNISYTFKKVLIPVFETIHKDFESLYSSKLIETVSAAAKVFEALWESVQGTNLTEEQKEEIKESQKQWGKYGWTQPPNSPVGIFNKCPDAQETADEAVLQYCSEDDIKELFEGIKTLTTDKLNDLNESIFAYENQKYKSAVLILLGMIDSCLIELQRDEDRNGRKERPTGKGASKNLFGHIKEETNIEKTIIVLGQYFNIKSCLEEMFKFGDDFKKQPTIINRNFIDHGMLLRQVNRKDCIQVFLLYYNLIHFLHNVNFIKETENAG